MSLRWRVALALAAIASAAVVAVGAANYRTISDRLFTEVDRSLLAVDPRFAERILSGPERLPERNPFAGFDAQVTLLDGTVLSSTFEPELRVSDDELRLADRRREPSFVTVDTDGGRTRVVTIGFDRGIVQIGRSLDEIDRVLQALRARIALWSLAVMVIASAAGWWIAGRATAPLRRLTDTAEHVATTGRLDAAIDPGAVGAGGDDEVGRLARAFDRMLVALRRSRDDQQRLVQDAGHELRTPLTSLRTNLDTLRRYPDLAVEDRTALLDDLRSETIELSQLVDEIILLASGTVSDEPLTTVDLFAMASEVAERFTRRTGRRIVVDGAPATVVGRRAGLQRAVACLVDNACKFDPGIAPVVVRVARHGAEVGVDVVDHGPGIPAGDLDRVFDRFHRGESARSMPGSGLGLSIVREIARRHGGEARASNEPGGGARVGFSVPTGPHGGATGPA